MNWKVATGEVWSLWKVYFSGFVSPLVHLPSSGELFQGTKLCCLLTFCLCCPSPTLPPSLVSAAVIYKWESVILEQKNAANHCHLGSSEALCYGNAAFFRPTCGAPAHSNAVRWKGISGRVCCSLDAGVEREKGGLLKKYSVLFLLGMRASRPFLARCKDVDSPSF